jgi:NADPH:quinone reductase-like Zn-dependent oxidoreductase
MKIKKRWIVLFVLVAGVAAYWMTRPKPVPPRLSGESMQGIVYHEYGTADVLRLESIDKYLPNDNQVLIKVRAASVNPLDWHYIRGTPYAMRLMGAGLRRPIDPRLGVDLAGEVVEVGRNVTRFKPGDEVFGVGDSALSEYSRASAARIAPKPAGITFEQAAAVPVAGITALQALRDKGHVQAGQKVLINGASGGVGTFAVQIAKALGAEVTGVCSGRNFELVRSLGADHVIDYTKEDFTLGQERYDVILDNVGTRPLREMRRALKPKGICVLVGGGGPDAGKWLGPIVRPFFALLYSPIVSQSFTMLFADVTNADLVVLKEMMESKKVTPVIDRTFPLAETPEAIRYLEAGHARGKVIVEVGAAVASH